ncbi:MAG: hypothetical protein IPL61_02995 [Myxococcales bacterium]|nr:hypothetical protein [Myxococcales bacterium]
MAWRPVTRALHAALAVWVALAMVAALVPAQVVTATRACCCPDPRACTCVDHDDHGGDHATMRRCGGGAAIALVAPLPGFVAPTAITVALTETEAPRPRIALPAPHPAPPRPRPAAPS